VEHVDRLGVGDGRIRRAVLAGVLQRRTAGVAAKRPAALVGDIFQAVGQGPGGLGVEAAGIAGAGRLAIGLAAAGEAVSKHAVDRGEADVLEEGDLVGCAGPLYAQGDGRSGGGGKDAGRIVGDLWTPEDDQGVPGFGRIVGRGCVTPALVEGFPVQLDVVDIQLQLLGVRDGLTVGIQRGLGLDALHGLEDEAVGVGHLGGGDGDLHGHRAGAGDVAALGRTLPARRDVVTLTGIPGDAGGAGIGPAAGGRGGVVAGGADRGLKAGIGQLLGDAIGIDRPVVGRPAAAPDEIADRVRLGDMDEAVAVVEVVVDELQRHAGG